MTRHQIQQVFNALKIGTKDKRLHFCKLAKLGGEEPKAPTFIALSDNSFPKAEEEDNAKLASTSE